MKISIITPNYNSGKFIERTMLSVLNQKGNFELEYIIMDGGSTDNSIDLVESVKCRVESGEFEQNFQKIKFIRNSEKDKGQSNAINKGLKLATGDIITYINSDDTYEPGTLQTIAEELGTSDKLRNYGKCKIINENNQEIRKFITRYKNITGKNYSYKKLLAENFISQMTVFWKREILEKIGYFNENEHLVMDYEYRLRIGTKYSPLYIDKHLANFRLYNTSKSGAGFVKQFADELRIAQKFANGKYKLAIWKHKINRWKIVMAYKVLGWMGK